MRGFLFALTPAAGGLLLSGAFAFAQNRAADAPPTLPPVPAPDAGNRGEAPPEAEPITVQGTIEAPGPKTSAAPPAALPSATAPIASRDRGHARNGFYLAVTSSIGGLSVWGDGPTGSASLSGFASGGSLSIGGSPIPGLAIAGVLGSTSATGTFHGGPTYTVTTTTGTMKGSVVTLKGNARVSSFLIGVLVDWFPVPADGWHVGGVVGLGGASVTDDANNSIVGGSVGGSVFGGYQWWLGSSWSLGVSGFVMIAPSLNLEDSNRNESGYHMMPLSAGVQGMLLYY